MARYLLGAPIRLSATFRDVASGSLVTPTTIVLTVQKPDLTLQAYASPTADGLGTYHQDVPAADLTQLGQYKFKWVSTGPGAGVIAGAFDVADPFGAVILSLADAKDALNIPAATTTNDAEIQSKVDTVVSALERITGGPLVNRLIVERCQLVDCGRAILLRYRPVVSVQSIADVTGVVVSVVDVDVDPNSGVVRRQTAAPFLVASGTGAVSVTYTAGWGVPTPAAFNEAARLIVQHLWETQRGGSRRPGMGMGAVDEMTTDMFGLGFAIPNRAAELMGPYAAEVAVG